MKNSPTTLAVLAAATHFKLYQVGSLIIPQSCDYHIKVLSNYCLKFC